MNLFCSHLTATLNLLPLGIIKASFVSTLAYSQISVFRFHLSVRFLLLRNHLRGFYLQDLVEVVAYDEDDDEGGDDEGTEDGECGGEALCHTIDKTVSCPVLQEGVEENYEGSTDHGGDADEPEVETTKEPGYVPSLCAMYFTQRHLLLSRTSVKGDSAPNAHEANDEADAGEYPRGITHDFDEEDFVVERIAKVCHTWLQGFGIDALHGIG